MYSVWVHAAYEMKYLAHYACILAELHPWPTPHLCESLARLVRLSVSRRSASESVEGLALALECVDDVHGRHCMATGVLRVGDRVANDVLKKDLEDTTSLFVYETRDTLHPTTTSETTHWGEG
jgi:hypothetical protein